DLNGTKESFILADKFYKDCNILQELNISIDYLCIFGQNNQDFQEKSLMILQQKAIYEEIYGIYKKALKKEKSDQDQKSNKNQEDNKENQEESDNKQMNMIQNPKKKYRKGRLL
ncbi:5889_t:CDS:2, partial [Scutellospora calospora]